MISEFRNTTYLNYAEPANREAVERILNSLLPGPVSFVPRLDAGPGPVGESRSRPAGPTPPVSIPAHAVPAPESRDEKIARYSESPLVKRVLELFDGKIVDIGDKEQE